MDMDADNQTICLMQACPARKTQYGTNQTHRPAPLPCCPLQADSPLWTEPDAAVMAFV